MYDKRLCAAWQVYAGQVWNLVTFYTFKVVMSICICIVHISLQALSIV